MAVIDADGRLYTFAHQYSFGAGVADDDFPYSGNNAAIAANWLALVTGGSAKWKAQANLDLGSLISAIEKAIQDAGPIISAVIAVVGAAVTLTAEIPDKIRQINILKANLQSGASTPTIPHGLPTAPRGLQRHGVLAPEHRSHRSGFPKGRNVGIRAAVSVTRSRRQDLSDLRRSPRHQASHGRLRSPPTLSLARKFTKK